MYGLGEFQWKLDISVLYIYLTTFNGDKKLCNTWGQQMGVRGVKPLLGSANTVQRAPTGVAGVKPLLG